MVNSTPKKTSKTKIVELKKALKPSKDTLFFLQLFARAYSPMSVGMALS